MTDAIVGFAACWLLGTVLMWRMLAGGLSSDSPVMRAFMALLWPWFLWREGR